MNENDIQLIIPAALAQAILDYLARRPYAEVYQLIAALQQLQPAPEAPPELAAKGNER